MMVMSVRSLDAVSKAQRRTSAMTQETLQLERTVVDLETGVRGFMLTDDETLPGALPHAVGSGSPSASPSSPDLSEPADGRAPSRAITRPPQRVRPRVHRAARSSGTRRPSVLVATTEGKQRLDSLRAEFAALSGQQQALTLERRATLAEPAPAHARGSAPAAPASRSRCSSLLAWVLNRRVLSPVRRVSLAARKLERGDLDTRVATTGAGEIGQLARSFNAMAASLADARRGPARAVRPPARHPGPHHHDDLGQGPRRPLPARQRALARGHGPGRRRRHRPHRRRAVPARRRRRASASPTSRSCAPARPPSTSATPPPTGARSRSSSSRSPTRTAPSTPPARWAPTSASAAARWPRPSTPRARSPSSWPT